MDEVFRLVVGDLVALRARYALVGGHAVSVHTEPRFTRDVDLAVAVGDDREAEALVASLGDRGYRIVAVIEHDATDRLATVRLEHRSTPGVMIDLLFASAGIEREVVDGARSVVVVPDVHVPVASVGHLLAMKVLSMDDRTRPQDRLDLGALLRTASVSELQVARESLETIAERGFARGRDLLALFTKVQRELAPS